VYRSVNKGLDSDQGNTTQNLIQVGEPLESMAPEPIRTSVEVKISDLFGLFAD